MTDESDETTRLAQPASKIELISYSTRILTLNVQIASALASLIGNDRDEAIDAIKEYLAGTRKMLDEIRALTGADVDGE